MKKHISLILVLISLTVVLVGCGGETYEDGEHTGQAEGFNQIEVLVTVEEGEISSVEITEEDETDEYAAEALEKLPDLIAEKNSTDVDAISGATVTSQGIINAVNNALGLDE